MSRSAPELTQNTQAPTNAALTTLALQAAMAAARAILAIYGRPISAVAKSDGSPVTEADHAAEAIILDHLAPTGIPVLGEESVAAGIIPELGARYFVVDPLDGTKEFIKRNGEFTVNIALIEDGVPVMGVVLAPVSGEAFVGDARGAYACDTVTGSALHVRPITVSHSPALRVVASRSHHHAALATLCAALDITDDVSVGSSLKFCLLARGDAELYPRFTPTCEWDTAAGQAVLEAAGGAVVTLDGERLRYGKGTLGFLNPYFVAAANQALARQAAAEMARILA